MRVAVLGRDGDVDGAALAHLGRDEVVRVRDGGAGVAACCAGLFDVGGWLGAYGEWGPACGGDGGGQGLEAFEVGHAEGTPVAAVDWQVGVSGWGVSSGGGGRCVQTTKRKSDWDFRVMYSCSFSMVRGISGW